jgi:hypothetical protein
MANPNPSPCGILSLAVILTAILAIPSLAQDANDVGWQSKALAAGLSEPEVQQLQTNRILITNQTYKQIFTAYISIACPVFITSDSLLNAYHVLYEESILRLEQAGTRRLPDILQTILTEFDAVCAGLDHHPDLVAAARERAIIVLGTARKLLDDEFTVSDDALMAIIHDEVAKIVAATVRMKPEWLGPAEPDLLELDYTRYRPRGFYTRSDALTRYFRAVAWLQSIPFRVSRDDELLAILILGSCLSPERFNHDTETYQACRTYFRAYTDFLGVGDDWDLITATDAVAEGLDFSLEAKRAELIAQAQQQGGPLINDQLRFAPDDPNTVAEPNFRIVSAYRLPEAVLFQRTTDIRAFPGRALPNGLELCIALGSPFARAKLEDPDKDRLLATIDTNLDLFAGSSLYYDYLSAIAALLDTPEPNAPDFMLGGPWQAKSCGTALAGWAQLRHTWALQAKQNVSSWGTSAAPPAVVEPDPDFFRRLGDLARRTHTLLTSADAFGSHHFDLMQALTDVAQLLQVSSDWEDSYTRFWSLSWGEKSRLNLVYQLARSMDEDLETVATRLEQMADDLAAGLVDPALEPLTAAYHTDIEPLWTLLEQTSRHLESIARKQLDGAELALEEEEFLYRYGHTLAHIMLYAGNELTDPRDDAPRIVDVYSNPWIGQNLHVGISRARALYVLYPWEGKVYVYRGAVMPYYEFTDPARLTDAEWQTRLDTDTRPNLPTWLTPIVTPQGLTTPEYEPIITGGRSHR